MNPFRWGLEVWGAWVLLFLLLELPGHFGWVPWPTLSRTAWDAETAWAPVRILLLAFLVILLAHICFRLSALALIVTAVIGAIAVALHVLHVYK